MLFSVNWEGDSKKILSHFPTRIRIELGFEIYALQKGERPSDFKPMKTVGSGVYELRAQDHRSCYRVIYIAKLAESIFILHCFEKKSTKTPLGDLKVAKLRLAKVKKRLKEGT